MRKSLLVGLAVMAPILFASGASACGWGYGYGWGWGYGGGFATSTAPVTITEGTFILDLVDKDTKKLAWRATWVGEPRGRAPTQQELNEGAADLMAKVPAATAK